MKKTLSVIFSLLIVLSAFSGLTVTAGAETDLRGGILDLADTGAEADLADTGDASVNNRDAMILDRYVAGWPEYDKYFITIG